MKCMGSLHNSMPHSLILGIYLMKPFITKFLKEGVLCYQLERY